MEVIVVRENKNGPTPQQPMLPKWLLITMIAFFPLIGIFIIAVSVWLLIAGISTALPVVFLVTYLTIFISLGVFLVLLGWNFYSSVTANYNYTTIGLLVKYPFQTEILLPWTSFQQVCVCYAAYTTRGEQIANSVICFVKRGEKRNGSMRWKTDNPFRHRSVICIDYSPELYEQVKAVCPYEISDLRHTMAYKMY